MNWFDVDTIAFEILNYPLSYIELIGTIFGLIAVYLSSRANIWTWPASIVNEFAFFWLFFQVQLYADMGLQIYFFIATLYGWYYWNQKPNRDTVTQLTANTRWIYVGVLLVGTIIVGIIVSKIHVMAPSIFTKPASYPYADAFTSVASVLAMILLSRKKIENWILWIAVDIVAVILYYLKGIHLVMIEYVVFMIICIFGYIHWRRQLTVNSEQ